MSLTTSKIQFRRALYIMTRFSQQSATREQLSRYQIDDAVWDQLVERQLVQISGTSLQLSTTGFATAQKVFPSILPALQAVSDDQYDRIESLIFISDLWTVDGQVQVQYLADEQGNVCDQVDDALICPVENWRLKKKLMREFHVEPLFRAVQVGQENTDQDDLADHRRNDYGDWLK